MESPGGQSEIIGGVLNMPGAQRTPVYCCHCQVRHTRYKRDGMRFGKVTVNEIPGSTGINKSGGMKILILKP